MPVEEFKARLLALGCTLQTLELAMPTMPGGVPLYLVSRSGHATTFSGERLISIDVLESVCNHLRIDPRAFTNDCQ